MSTSVHRLRELAHVRAQKSKQISAAKLGIASIVVLTIVSGLAYASFSANQPVDHAVNYDASLVVHDQPLHAEHEMGNEMASSIPFLPEGSPQPKIVIQQEFFDFKQVGPTEVVEHQFVIANEGEAPLTISQAFTTCACTTADFSASVIPPGKIAIVTLIFDAGYHDVRGETVRRGLIIESNDPSNPHAEIWTQASVSINS